jgi:hypothetical protein
LRAARLGLWQSTPGLRPFPRGSHEIQQQPDRGGLSCAIRAEKARSPALDLEERSSIATTGP